MRRMMMPLFSVFLLIATAAAGQPKRMKPLLLVIDVQNHYLKYMDPQQQEQALEMINGAIWLFRKHGMPVCRTYTVDPALGLKPGNAPYEYPQTVLVGKDDLTLQKRFYSAFKGTDLDSLLRKQGCNTLFICGLNAAGCVMATYCGALERDYTAFLIKGAVMSHKEKYVEFVEDVMETVSFNTLKVMLDNIDK